MSVRLVAKRVLRSRDALAALPVMAWWQAWRRDDRASTLLQAYGWMCGRSGMAKSHGGCEHRFPRDSCPESPIFPA